MLLPFRKVSASSSSRIIWNRSIFRASQSAIAVSLLLLSGKIPTTARALSAASSGSTGLTRANNNRADICLRSPIIPTRSTLLSGSSILRSASTTLSAKAEEDSGTGDSSTDDAQNRPEGKTGWNHNPPKNPDFWTTEGSPASSVAGAAVEVEAIAKAIVAEEAEAPKFRTGWLHSTASSTDRKKAAAVDKSSAGAKSSAAGKARRRLEEAMKARRENHRIVSPGAIHACGKDRRIAVTEHRMSVPLAHPKEEEPATGSATSAAGGISMPRSGPTESIDVAFTVVEEIKDEDARSWYETVTPTLTPSQRASAYVKRCGMTSAKDMLLFLQGGPGFGAPAPVAALDFAKGGGSWGAAALDRYRRVVLLDQRGTGRSSPLTKQSLERRFPGLFALDGIDTGGDDDDDDEADRSDPVEARRASHPEEFEEFTSSLDDATGFMANFRADSIVRDAEQIRRVLMYTPSVDDEDDPDDDSDAYDPSLPNPWGCVLGQSFGGFCTMTYLSQIEHPPKISLLTGGIAPMLADSAVDVYTSLWKRVKERNLRYYDMYPGDVAVVKRIVRKLLRAEDEGSTPRLPSGGKLTARRFLQLGMMLGGSPSSFASMHELLASAFLQPPSSEDEAAEFSRGFLKAVDHAQPFDEHPIYFWLHESIYADANSVRPGKEGSGNGDIDVATNWSADNAYEAKVGERSSGATEYDYRATSREDSGLPVLFFGEMVFPWMAEDYAECGGLGCTALANALATKKDWGPLYDADRMRAVLSDGRSRSAAAVYYDDMYVDFDHSMKVAARGGPLEKCKVYVTNDYQHSGLRDDGAAIFNKLHGMATGSVRTPS